jgi:hypothetical protein
MIKFHQIPTIEYKPISHEKTYLFSNYEKVFNFLKFNSNISDFNILSKPVQTNNNIDWYSKYSNLKFIEEFTILDKETILQKYWLFMDSMSLEINKLKNSKEEDKLNWANILEKVFNHQNNLIFSNGENISIIWGWEFYNNNNYKPSFISNQNEIKNIDSIDDPIDFKEDEEKTFEEKSIVEENTDDLLEEELEPILEDEEKYIEEEYFEEETIKEESSFLKFLKWFASNFWWLLFVLLIICTLLLLLKNCEHQENYNRLNNDIENVEGQLTNICN